MRNEIVLGKKMRKRKEKYISIFGEVYDSEIYYILS